MKLDLTGQRFGMLQVLECAGVNKRQGCPWRCVCDCGQDAVVSGACLRGGHTRSCGCLRCAVTVQRMLTHGRTDTSEYHIWRTMRQRCSDPSFKSYRYYGARGIRVCKRWQKFEHFYADMGERPSPQHSVDRIDGQGDYEPANCRWP